MRDAQEWLESSCQIVDNTINRWIPGIGVASGDVFFTELGSGVVMELNAPLPAILCQSIERAIKQQTTEFYEVRVFSDRILFIPSRETFYQRVSNIIDGEYTYNEH